MKAIITGICALILPFLLTGCGKSNQEHGHDHDHMHDSAAADDHTNVLYDEVMKLHDEGMEKMDEIYKLKETLKDKVTTTKDMVREKKEQLDAAIQKLDSASKGMMVWMREFHPETDSLDEEAYREYLETEMEKVKKVKEDILQAIERAKEQL